MASAGKSSPIPLELSRPLLIGFNGGEQGSRASMDPFDVEPRETILEIIDDMLQGRRCLACLEGEWLFMLEDTSQCFLLSLSSLRKIPLPPLLMPVELLSRCAISSPTPPECTIVFSTNEDYLVYCRPGDEEWCGLPDETDGTYVLIKGDIASARGRMYVPTEVSTFIAIDVSMPSSYGVAIERRGIPHPNPMRWRCEERLVQSDGDILLLQFYIHGFHNSEVVDMDIHRLDTSAYIWNKVESIGDRTIFVSDNNCVVLSSASRAGVRPGNVYLLHKHCRQGVRLYTIRLHDRTMSCALLPVSYDDMYWVVPSR
nr:unnamed protein product [Digitaria exilis]